jgi:hypothetical protein
MFSKQKKTSIIRNFCKSGLLAVPVNPDKWSGTVFDLPGSDGSPLATDVNMVRKFVFHQRYRSVISWRMASLHELSLLMAFELFVAAIRCCSEALEMVKIPASKGRRSYNSFKKPIVNLNYR